jgi:hypothetical protein
MSSGRGDRTAVIVANMRGKIRMDVARVVMQFYKEGGDRKQKEGDDWKQAQS